MTESAEQRAKRVSVLREAHLYAKSLEMDHAALSDFACNEFGVSSMSELSAAQLGKLVGLLKRRGAKKPRRKRSPNGQPRRVRDNKPDGLITPRQQQAIAGMFKDVEGLLDHGVGRASFCHSVIGKPWPQTRAEAQKVIEGLKGWLSTCRKRQ